MYLCVKINNRRGVAMKLKDIKRKNRNKRRCRSICDGAPKNTQLTASFIQKIELAGFVLIENREVKSCLI